MEGDYSDDDINPEDDDVLRELFEDAQNFEEEEEGEDLYGSDFEKDYQYDPTQDFYEEEAIDPEVQFHYNKSKGKNISTQQFVSLNRHICFQPSIQN